MNQSKQENHLKLTCSCSLLLFSPSSSFTLKNPWSQQATFPVTSSLSRKNTLKLLSLPHPRVTLRKSCNTTPKLSHLYQGSFATTPNALLLSLPKSPLFLSAPFLPKIQLCPFLPKTTKQKLSANQDFPDASLKQPLCPYLFFSPGFAPPTISAATATPLHHYSAASLFLPACSWPSLHNRKHAPSSRIFLIFTGVALLFVLQIHYLIPLIANPRVTRGQICCSKTSPTWGSTRVLLSATIFFFSLKRGRHTTLKNPNYKCRFHNRLNGPKKYCTNIAH